MGLRERLQRSCAPFRSLGPWPRSSWMSWQIIQLDLGQGAGMGAQKRQPREAGECGGW